MSAVMRDILKYRTFIKHSTHLKKYIYVSHCITTKTVSQRYFTAQNVSLLKKDTFWAVKYLCDTVLVVTQ